MSCDLLRHQIALIGTVDGIQLMNCKQINENKQCE